MWLCVCVRGARRGVSAEKVTEGGRYCIWRVRVVDCQPLQLLTQEDFERIRKLKEKEKERGCGQACTASARACTTDGRACCLRSSKRRREDGETLLSAPDEEVGGAPDVRSGPERVRTAGRRGNYHWLREALATRQGVSPGHGG